jgi:hypothetical protein
MDLPKPLTGGQTEEAWRFGSKDKDGWMYKEMQQEEGQEDKQKGMCQEGIMMSWWQNRGTYERG